MFVFRNTWRREVIIIFDIHISVHHDIIYEIDQQDVIL